MTQGTGVGYTFDRDPVLTDAPVYFWGTKDYAPPRVSFEATVGLALLNRALFTLDFKSNHIWMEQFPAH